MSDELFDRNRRRLARNRAARIGPELFLLGRAFDDCLGRIAAIRRRFTRALLIGSPDPVWPQRLSDLVDAVDVVDPGTLFAEASGGRPGDEDRFDFGENQYDLVVAVGTLDTVNELPLALQLIRRAMVVDACLIGAIAGGDTLPALRAAMMEVDRAGGFAAARVHPRIDGPTLAGLLTAAGFVTPVIDVDRVTLRYPNLDRLVNDLRAMGANSLLTRRPPPFGKSELAAARAAFVAMGDGEKTTENVEILHFLGWTSAERQARN
nr:SAM-dependent methyltransferase [uncultured Sphingomonas sp.]